MKLAPGIYKHYKGNLYEVMGVAQHSETEEMMAVYKTLYGDHSLWVRPLSMFQEQVTTQEGNVPRFDLITPLPEA